MTLPSELKSSGPRQVSLTPRGWRRLFIFSLNVTFLIAVSLWVYTQAVNDGGTPWYRAESAGAQGMAFWTGWGWRTSAGLLIAAGIGLTRLRRQRRLLMYGRATEATVTGQVTPWWYRLRNKRGRPRRLQCEFLLLSGAVCRTTVEAYGKIPENGEVFVLYDPDEPKHALLYPTQMLKVERF